MIITGSVGGEGTPQNELILQAWIYLVRKDGVIHNQVQVPWVEVMDIYWKYKRNINAKGDVI